MTLILEFLCENYAAQALVVKLNTRKKYHRKLSVSLHLNCLLITVKMNVALNYELLSHVLLCGYFMNIFFKPCSSKKMYEYNIHRK